MAIPQSLPAQSSLAVAQLPAKASPEVTQQTGNASDTDFLLDTKAAAAYLNLKPLTLVDWRTKRQGPVFVKMHGAVRYLRSDLDAHIQACRKGA